MKLLLALVGLTALCGLASARINGNVIEKAERIVVGRRSTKGDDAMSVANCPRGYQVLSCHCGRYPLDNQPCDGVWVDQPDGYSCTARNSNWGRGVTAVARCVKFTSVDNSVGFPYNDRPQARCPPGYKVIDCNLHTGYRHKLDGPARSYIEGNVCYSSENCRYCKIQARCIIDLTKWNPGVLPEEVWGKACLDTPNAGSTTAGVDELEPTAR